MIPVLIGVAIALVIVAIVAAIVTDEPGFVVVGVMVALLACVLPSFLISESHRQATWRADYRAAVVHDLDEDGPYHIVDVSWSDETVDFTQTGKFCTAQVAWFGGKYVLVKETILCQP